jgi:signal transduction histidine kinase
VSEGINIELIARQGTSDNMELRDDLNRMNQVAQLGVTVEILGHELNTNERLIREGLRQLNVSGDPPGTEQVKMGFEALSQQLEFLSPLKISGTRTRRVITGREIRNYVEGFFEAAIRSRGIVVEATAEFEAFSIDEQPARLLPVFVNIINNSIYWLVNSRTYEPRICLGVVDRSVIISDNGPGVDSLDQDSLFKMFFTRKVSGGRGIGLYLCRVNLLAGGHSIRYVTDKRFKILSGASFAIEFKGADFG